MPIPESDFGPEEARQWMESKYHDILGSAESVSNEKKPHSAALGCFLTEDTAALAAACSEGAASGRSVEPVRGLDGLVALLSHARSDLAARGHEVLHEIGKAISAAGCSRG